MKDSDDTRIDNRLFAQLGLAPSHDEVERIARDRIAQRAERAQDESRRNRAAYRRHSRKSARG